MKTARALLMMLRGYGVTDVFGLPGETTLDLYRAWDEFSDIAYHMCRDERNSVFMADGYAKATGKVGICEGPSVGATHMVPGVTEAHGACIPMLVFTSDVELHTTKKNMLTGFNQTAIFEGITKESYTVTKGIELPFLIRRAFRAATSGRPGPVHIRIPMNIFSEELPDESIFVHPQYGKFPGVRSSASKEDIRKAVDELVRASRPVMICGQGAIHSGAWDAVSALARKMNIPVGSTINAKGIFQETHLLSLGVIGVRGGREWANQVILESDLVLLVGSSTDSAGTSGWRVPSSNSETKMIQIDISELELGNNYNVLPLLGDAKETLERILETLPENGRNPETPSWAAKVLAAGEAFEKKLAAFEKDIEDTIHPFSVSRLLERTMPEDAFYAIDPGIAAVYPAAFMKLKRAGRRCAYNFSMGALGYAIPAAIGARQGLPSEVPVIGLVGDGSFGFTAGELETASRLGLNITYILFDNASFGWIRGTEFVERRCPLPDSYDKFTCFAKTDYVKIAEGFGLKGYHPRSIKSLEETLKECMSLSGPKLVVLSVLPEDRQLPPVPGWYKYAKSAGLCNLYGSDCF